MTLTSASAPRPLPGALGVHDRFGRVIVEPAPIHRFPHLAADLPTDLPAVTLTAIAAGLHPVRDVEADPALAAIASDVDGLFPVLADCGHVEDYGLVTHTPCDLRLCWDCAATHTCRDCDHDARQGRTEED